MDNKELSQLSGSDGVVCGDENALLGETIYHYQIAVNPSETGRCSMKAMEIEFHRREGMGS